VAEVDPNSFGAKLQGRTGGKVDARTINTTLTGIASNKGMLDSIDEMVTQAKEMQESGQERPKVSELLVKFAPQIENVVEGFGGIVNPFASDSAKS